METVLRRVHHSQARSRCPVTVCAHKTPKYLFSVLGALLGILAGVVLGFYDPTSISSGPFPMFWYMFTVIPLYLIPQYTLGMVFKKPKGSRSIFKGMVAIPVSYAVTVALVSNRISLSVEQMAWRVFVLFLASGILTMIPALIAFCLSLFVYLLTGIDTCALSDSKKFGYLIEPNGGSIAVLETLVSRSDFFIGPAQKDDGTGYISAGKGPLRLGIYYKTLNKAIDSTFILYEVNNETVTGPADEDEVLDFQAEMSGLLESWKSRGKVEEYSLVRGSEIQQTLQRIEDELGPARIVKIPPVHEIKDWVRSFPKNYPSWFNFLVAIVSAILGGIIVTLLARFVK